MSKLTGASVLSAIVLAALLAGGVMDLKAEPRTAGAPSTAEAPKLERGGQVVQVVDGRTLRIDGRTVQLAGVKTPVPGQQCERAGRLEPCGDQATAALAKIVDLSVKPLDCQPAASGEAGLVTCLVEGRDVAETLVKQGRAVATGDRYAQAEAQARTAELGLWGSAWVPPEQWLAGERLPAEREQLAEKTRDEAAERKPSEAE
ncbi:nuclease [Caenispirillum salinarum AK4]|uniref:Nuclease n=1 Tax=Caenispirillum salinarum AK4 TaxID=1238182 RepID=K9HAA1_9PROT|nr:thermonuclease family protein [Caenispirillum salinarum]EKV27528.1 nuclease [Caenispirillum salinarum AK4]